MLCYSASVSYGGSPHFEAKAEPLSMLLLRLLCWYRLSGAATPGTHASGSLHTGSVLLECDVDGEQKAYHIAGLGGYPPLCSLLCWAGASPTVNDFTTVLPLRFAAITAKLVQLQALDSTCLTGRS